EVVIDRVIVRREGVSSDERPGRQRGRVAEAVEAGLDLGRGVIHIARVDDAKPEPQWQGDRHSQHFACGKFGRSVEPLSPHNYSFNSPLGWCPTCQGLGVQQGASTALLLRDPALSLREGAIAAWPAVEGEFLRFVEAIARHTGFSLDTPFAELTPIQQ